MAVALIPAGILPTLIRLLPKLLDECTPQKGAKAIRGHKGGNLKNQRKRYTTVWKVYFEFYSIN